MIRPVSRSGTGEVFGELALMDGGAVPRKATARCLDESELLFVSAEGFEEVKKYVTWTFGRTENHRKTMGKPGEKHLLWDLWWFIWISIGLMMV